MIRFRKGLSSAALLAFLVAAALSIPWMVEAIFPGGGGPAAPAPPEEPLWEESGYSDWQRQRDWEANKRWEEDAPVLAWAPNAGAEGASEIYTSDDGRILPDGETASATPTDEQNLRPGAFIEYDRYWDSLELVRQIFTGGAYVFLSPRTRLTAAYRELRFKDTTGRINGRGGWLEAHHRLNEELLLNGSIGLDSYDGLHISWHGHALAGWTPRPDLYASLTVAKNDMWERLVNIQDKLAVTTLTPYIYYAFHPRAWVEGHWQVGWLNDDNVRQSLGGEMGYFLHRPSGFSISGGAEAYGFQDATAAYWSPSFYSFVFGRLRATRNYNDNPFRAWPENTPPWQERWGYVAEYLAGFSDDSLWDHFLRGGLGYQLTRRVRLRAEISHLSSNSRFDSHYTENRANALIDVGF